MGQITTLSFLLLFAVSTVFFSLASCDSGFKKALKSRLMLEYDWPEPKKNLKRLPHPESCLHFYIVKADGSYFMKNCPINEIFDYRSLECKEKSMAKCWKDIVDKGKLKKLKRNFSCPFPWGLYPDVEDCSQFFECLGGIHYIRKCPASTVFDKAERTCVPTEKALCADESDVVVNGYKCPYKWGYFAHSADCSKYYECLRKVPNIRTCGKNLLFDNFRRNCFPAQEVACGKRLNPYVTIATLSLRISSWNYRILKRKEKIKITAPKEDIKIESSSNIPEVTASENTPTKDDDAHTSMPNIHGEETRQSTQAKATVVPLENASTSTKLDEVVAEDLTIPQAKTTKQDVVNVTPDDKILEKNISAELGKVTGENTTNLHDNTVENNGTKSDETANRNYSSNPEKSVEQAITTNIPATKTTLETITTKLDKVYDKTPVEVVHTSSSESSLINTEAKVDEKAKEIATTKQK